MDHFNKGFKEDITPPIRSYEIGKFARRICGHAFDKEDAEELIMHYKHELKLHAKLLA